MTKPPRAAVPEFSILPMPPGFIAPGGFRCEPPEEREDEIGEYLTSGTAARDQEAGFSRTYLVYEDETGDLLGFYSLLADALQLANRERKVGEYRTAPAIKIARLGLSYTLQGRGMGRDLFRFVLSQVLVLAEQIGVRYITLDAVAKKIGFYKKLGFRLTQKRVQASTELDRGSKDRSMLYDLGTLSARVSQAEFMESDAASAGEPATWGDTGNAKAG